MKKTVLITGGSRGIGREAALRLARDGWKVAINYRGNAEAADEVVDRIIDEGGEAVAFQGDVASEADVLALFDGTLEAFGRLDGFVNNAGIVAPSLKLADMKADRMKRVFDVNVFGAFLCAREAARRMSESRGGHGGAIVNVSSIAARLGSPFEYVDYAASKGAIDTMTIGLAKELGPEGIRVNAVRPGVILTDIHASGGEPGRAERIGATTPLGRAGETSEIANSILWLLSDEASYVTGALLDVSGGR